MTAPSSEISELIGRIYSVLPGVDVHRAPIKFRHIGRATSPRWIFPATADVHSIFRSWSPYKLTSRLAWQAIRCAESGRFAGMMPGVGTILVHDLPVIDWNSIGWKHSSPPTPVIYLGTPGPRQKAVVHLVDSASGQCEAVLKAPLRAGAVAAIAHESDVLAVMEDEFFSAAPSLLFSDRSRGIAMQDFLPGNSGDRSFLPEYQSLLRSLVLPDEHTTLAGQATQWQSHTLWDSLDRPHLAALAAALAEQSETSLLPACWMHGDFAPWNIRHAGGVAPRLIDWEGGRRAALPLQDAFHFLHMQQFLFHRRPESFTAAVGPLATTVGIPSLISNKLELAYLASSYFSCLTGDEPKRADFVFQTLSLALCMRKRTFGAAPPSRLRLVSSRPACQEQARTEMLGGLTAELERADIPYCILSGYEKAAAATGSDVDIMFRPADLARIPSVLARAAATAGGALVQAIQHETAARYFVLARLEGKYVTHLAVDAYGDYQRDVRTWLHADSLIARRRRYREFFRPAVADEFIYRFTKKVLKQSLSADQLKHLLHLFARDSSECQARLAEHWTFPLATQIERALLLQDRDWLVGEFPALKQALCEGRPVEGIFRRARKGLREALRLFMRVLEPTGLLIRIISEDCNVASELADRLMCSLAPAFRRTEVTFQPTTLRQALAHQFGTHAARIRSTLVIETENGEAPRAERRWLTRPDLVLNLHSEMLPGLSSGPAPRTSNVIVLSADEFPDDLAKKATAAVLDWLAARINTRLKVSGARLQRPLPRQRAGSTEVDFESAGSD